MRARNLFIYKNFEKATVENKFKLLLGSVEFTEKMELEYRTLGLTSSITKSVGSCSAKRILKWHYFLLMVPVLAYVIIRLIDML